MFADATTNLCDDTTNGTTQMPKIYMRAVKHGMSADATTNLCDVTTNGTTQMPKIFLRAVKHGMSADATQKFKGRHQNQNDTDQNFCHATQKFKKRQQNTPWQHKKRGLNFTTFFPRVEKFIT